MIKRVLIVNPFGIGDALFVTPVIRAFHEQGAEKIDLIVGKRTKELFETNPFVNEIFVFDREKIKSRSMLVQFLDSIKFFMRLQKNQYDLLFDISFAWQYVTLGFLLQIPKRVGFNYKNRGTLLTERINLPDGYSKKHVVEYYMDLLALLGISPSSQELEMYVIASDIQKASNLLQSVGIGLNESFVAVAPGGGESWGIHARLKRWPAHSFCELIELLRTKTKVSFRKVVLIGGASEFELAEELVKQNPEIFVNLCGKCELRTSATILKKASCLVANDGGLVHLAASVRTPVVALFGPVDPKVYGPYPLVPTRVAVTNDGPECRPCYQNMRYNSLCVHVKCLTELSPERVLAQLDQTNFWKIIEKETRSL